jgi:Tfp pilus assembly protein PilO
VQIKNRQQLLVIVAVSAVILFAGDRLLLTPLTGAWHARQDAIAKLQKDVDEARKLRQRELTIRRYWRDISERSLTNDTSAAEQQMVQAITRWGERSGVVLTGINPTWKHDSENYATYECHVDATGDLGRLSRFLFNAEQEKLALRFQTVELSARDKEGKQLALSMQISGLILNTPTR